MGQAVKNITDGEIKSINITVYEGTLKEYLANAKTLKSNFYRAATQNVDEAIGAVAAHESVHATDKDNIKNSIENATQNTSHDIEKLPNEAEKGVLKELFNQKVKL